MATKFKIDELKKFFTTYGEILNRIEQIAPLCTNITSREDITGLNYDGDNDISIHVWSSDCGNDCYWFPLEYLTLDDEKIKDREREKAEKARRAIEREKRREKRAKEKAERREYERLKKKYEGS